MDVSAIQPQLPKPSQDDFISSKKKKKISDESEQISTSITDVVMLLGENIQTIGLELSRSIAFEKDECYRALRKIPDHPTQMVIFFNLPSSVRLEWVRRFLSDH
ncbi:hypothetical protein Gotri_024933 [Gossypium trilobum]|uniref:Uncharacterized protein n=1 Tax=Gossypium trilobum TaxID=34281 RepID=A0A7J9FJ88_9ROSI|nr:hypothetical protein [Gossypium trilobum]